MQQKRQDYLNELYNQIADELSISDTMTTKAISSYEAVGKWLGDCEPGLDVKIMPQGSFNLGTVIKPLSDKDDYDIDLVCLLKNGGELEAKKIKNVVGDRLKEHKMYYSMLEKEGKRCWTLQYDEFHMDILPSVPNNIIFDEQKDTELRLTHKNSQNQYEDRYSNPYQYRIWFENCMQTILQNVKKDFAYRNKVEISQVATYRVKTPLQKAVQLLKRHRDIMFEKVDCDDAPISIIITTLAGKAYNNETNLYDALKNIVEFMPNYIEIDNEGKYRIENPVMKEENFADKWNENHRKFECFDLWLQAVRKDVIDNPLNIIGVEEISKLVKKNFGEGITNKAFSAIAESNRFARQNQTLYINGLQGGLAKTSNSEGQPVPEHTFYGKE